MNSVFTLVAGISVLVLVLSSAMYLNSFPSSPVGMASQYAPVLTATTGDGVVDLKWTAMPGAKYYTLHRDHAPCGTSYPGIYWHHISDDILSYSDSPVVNYSTYCYGVSVCYSSSCYKSDTIEVVPQPETLSVSVSPSSGSALVDEPIEFNPTVVGGTDPLTHSWVLSSFTGTGGTDSCYLVEGAADPPDPRYFPVNVVCSEEGTATVSLNVFDADGRSGGETVTAVFTSEGTPPLPTNLVAVPGDELVALTWLPSVGADRHTIGWNTNGSTLYDLLTQIPSSSPPAYSHENLTNGTKYYYALKACNTYGCSDWSEQVSATPSSTLLDDTEPPIARAAATPTNADIGETIGFDGTGSTDNVGVASYSWDFDAGNGIQVNSTSPTPMHSYSSEGTYIVTLTVEDAAGNSDTDTVEITVSESSSLPAVPNSLNVLSKDRENWLWWDPLDAHHYVIGWNLNNSTSVYTEMDNVPAIIPYAHTGLTNGTTYYYSIKACNPDNECSAWFSPNQSAAPSGEDDFTAPAQVDDLGVSDKNSSWIELEWTAVGDDGTTGVAAEYDLRYSTSPLTALTFSSATAVIGETLPSAPGTTETFGVHGLSANTKYYFALKVLDEQGNSSPISNVVSETTDSGGITLPAPVLTAEAGDGFVELNWAFNSTYPADFNIFRREVFPETVWGSFESIDSTPDKNYLDEAVVNDTNYQYYVVAEYTSPDTTHKSPNSNTVNAIPAAQEDLIAPDAPDWLTVSSIGDSEVELEWNENTESDLSHYVVHYGEYSGDPDLKKTAVSSRAIISGLNNGITYYFAVLAVDSAGNESPLSTEVSAVPREEAPPESDEVFSPENLEAELDEGRLEATLTWDAPSHEPDRYRVYRKEGSGSFELLDSTALTYFTDSEIEFGKDYWYAVTSYLDGEESLYSNKVKVEVPEEDKCNPAEDTVCDTGCERDEDPDCLCNFDGNCEAEFENSENCPEDCPPGISGAMQDYLVAAGVLVAAIVAGAIYFTIHQ